MGQAQHKAILKPIATQCMQCHVGTILGPDLSLGLGHWTLSSPSLPSSLLIFTQHILYGDAKT